MIKKLFRGPTIWAIWLLLAVLIFGIRFEPEPKKTCAVNGHYYNGCWFPITNGGYSEQYASRSCSRMRCRHKQFKTLKELSNE